MTITVVGFTPDNWTCALTTLRLAGPIRAGGMQLLPGNDDHIIYPERISQADVVVIQRNFARYTDLYERVVEQAHAEGKPVIFEIDDLLFDLPEGHPDRNNHYYDDAFVPMLRAVVEAQGITVGTSQLRDYYSAFNPNLWVLPNYLNDEAWPLRQPPVQLTATPEHPLLIGYMGGASHQPDLDEIVPVLRSVGQTYCDRIVLWFCGIKPPKDLVDAPGMCRVEWLAPDEADYKRFAAALANLGIHLFIAPLRDTPFNRSKSPIKFLEYSALGAPGIYSNVMPYSEVVLHGETGMLASDIQEWENCLREYIESPSLRQQIGLNAQTAVRQRWLLSAHADEWQTVYEQIVHSQPVSVTPVVQRILKQVQSWQQTSQLLPLGPQWAQELAKSAPGNSSGPLQPQASPQQIRIVQLNQTVASLTTVTQALQTQLAAREQNIGQLSGALQEREAQITRHKTYEAHLESQVNLLNAQVAQRDQYIATLIVYARHLNKLAGDLLKGRVVHAMLSAQKWARTLFYPGQRYLTKLPVVPPLPTMLPVTTEAADGLDGFNNSLTANERYKQSLTRLYGSVLTSFFATGNKLAFPTSERPVLSIIVPLHNRAELTLQCLRSILANTTDAYEVILVNDASTDDTTRLLDRISGVTIIHNKENLGYLRSCNAGAGQARGEHLLFLNSDIQLSPGSIDSALKTIRSSDDIGAVGAKIILLDGALQEAGSIIWNDGSCIGYGRGDSPTAPPYMFARDVDFCSGAFLMTPRKLFEQVGGLDDTFSPAYYEDSDYCLTLHELGKRVIYDPNAVLTHYETASHQSAQVMELGERNRQKLVKKHIHTLKLHREPDPLKTLFARITPTNTRQRVLFIDDCVPHSSLGSGFPRAREMLLALAEAGYQVTMLPMNISSGEWDEVYRTLPNTVEAALGYGAKGLELFFEQRHHYYDAIIVSRPHNARLLFQIAEQHPDWFTGTRIIYDAEAIFALREAEQRKLRGEKLSKSEIDANIRQEVDLARVANAVICVSESEGQHFIAAGFKEVFVLGHAVNPQPTPRCFQERQGLLFVGAIYNDNSPNADAIHWFVREVLPLIRKQLGQDIPFTVAGLIESPGVQELASKGVRFTGRVDDLTPLYDQARMFVAPARFAAGIPIKVLDASAHGVPVVCTSLLANQVGWQDGVDLLVGDTATDFAHQCVQLYKDGTLWETLRANALRHVEQECSTEAFHATLNRIISGS